jgi:hypothetical protein
MLALEEVGVRGWILLRKLSLSRTLATQAVQARETRYWRIRPLLSQQEEVMISMKTCRITAVLSDVGALRISGMGFTHDNETSADDSQVVCYCVS